MSKNNIKKIILFIFLVSLFLITFKIVENRAYAIPAISMENLNELTNKNEDVFVLFERDDCKYCVDVKQTIRPLLKDNLINFVSVDTSDYKDVKEKYNLKVVPTFIHIENGKEVNRIEGEKSFDYYQDEFKNWIK